MDMSKSITSIAKPLRICKNCIYYDRTKHAHFDIANCYCRKIHGYVGDSEYMMKDCVRLSLREVDEMDKQ